MCCRDRRLHIQMTEIMIDTWRLSLQHLHRSDTNNFDTGKFDDVLFDRDEISHGVLTVVVFSGTRHLSRVRSCDLTLWSASGWWTHDNLGMISHIWRLSGSPNRDPMWFKRREQNSRGEKKKVGVNTKGLCRPILFRYRSRVNNG